MPGRSLLHRAAQDGDIHLVESLLAAGVEIEERDWKRQGLRTSRSTSAGSAGSVGSADG